MFDRKAIISDWVKRLPESQKEVWLRTRKACDKSLYYMIRDIGAFTPKTGGDASLEIHKPVCDSWQDRKVLRQFVYMPRFWRKSTCLTIWGNIWEYLQNPEARILIPSEKQDTAAKWVMQMGNLILRNARLRWVYPELQLVDDAWIKSHRWSSLYLELPRQGIYPEATIECVGIRGAAQGGHYDIISPDDLVGEKGMESDLVLADAKRWFDNIEELLVQPSLNAPDASRIHGAGCLTADTTVLTGSLRQKGITELVPGDTVMTYENGFSRPRIVEAVLDQGEDDIFQVDTLRRSIRGNYRHPFLTTDGTWKKMGELVKGDRIIVHDHAGIHKSIPAHPDLPWFLGMLVGDGSIVPHKKSFAIAVADGIHEDVRERTIKCYQSVLKRNPKKGQHGQWMAWSSEWGRVFESWGMVKKAKEKTIPGVVFGWPIKDRVEFIRGLLAADGSRIRKGVDYWNIEVASKPLIESLRDLCLVSGVAAGRMRQRTRTLQPPCSPAPVTTTFYGLTVNLALKRTPFGGDFCVEKITHNRIVGRERVYDLTVEGNHNFIANGFVVHNTHWSPGDLGEYVQENYPEYKWIIVPCRKTTTEKRREGVTILNNPKVAEGESNFPAGGTTEYYVSMAANPAKEVQYWSQHMNMPTGSSTLTKFDYNWIRWYHQETRKNESSGEDEEMIVCDDGQAFPLAGMNKWGFIDPGGFAETKMITRGSRNAILIACQPDNSPRKFVLEAWAGRMKEPKDFLDRIFDFQDKWLCRMWYIETIAAQKYIYRDIIEDRKRRDKKFPLSELDPDVGKDAKAGRITALLDPMSRGEYFLHRRMKDLIGEIRTYHGGDEVKDLIDMLSVYNKTKARRTEKKEGPVKEARRVEVADDCAYDDGASVATGY